MNKKLSLKNSSGFTVHVFFIDMVSLSDTSISLFDQQQEKIKILLDIIKKSKQYRHTFVDATSTTGDGVVLCFQNDIRLPLDLAIEVNRQLRKYNKNKPETKKINVRIGISSGTIFKTRSIGGRQNYWGPALIYAQRIMSCGTSEHILLDEIAEQLADLEGKYKKSIHYLGETKIKHGRIKKIYSAYGKDFGNKNTPENIIIELQRSDEGTGRIIYESLLKNRKETYMELLKNMKLRYINVHGTKFVQPAKKNTKKRGKKIE